MLYAFVFPLSGYDCHSNMVSLFVLLCFLVCSIVCDLPIIEFLSLSELQRNKQYTYRPILYILAHTALCISKKQ